MMVFKGLQISSDAMQARLRITRRNYKRQGCILERESSLMRIWKGTERKDQWKNIIAP